MKPTIKDIAKEAHVSVTTVSRVLSNKNNSNSDKTSKKVRKIAQQLGYRKNTSAVELVTRTSNVLAVILTATHTNFSDEIIAGIQDQAYKNGLDVIISYAGENNAHRQFQSIKTIIERSVKGILLLALELDEKSRQLLIQSKIPYVFLSLANDKKMPFISSNDFQIGYQATKYLIDKGHKKIGLAGLDDKSFMGKQRISGYKKALSDNKLKLDSEWITTGLFTYQDGLNSMKHYGKRPQVTGVVANSDLVGVGILNQARKFGVKVPRDLAIISIDGTGLCQIVHPQLTSITQSFYEMGINGVNFLLNSKEPRRLSKFTSIKIEEREST